MKINENCEECGKPIETEALIYDKFRGRWLCETCLEQEVDGLEKDIQDEIE